MGRQTERERERGREKKSCRALVYWSMGLRSCHHAAMPLPRIHVSAVQSADRHPEDSTECTLEPCACVASRHLHPFLSLSSLRVLLCALLSALSPLSALSISLLFSIFSALPARLRNDAPGRLRLVPGIRRQLRGRVHPASRTHRGAQGPASFGHFETFRLRSLRSAATCGDGRRGRATPAFGRSPASPRPPSDRCRRQGPVSRQSTPQRQDRQISPKKEHQSLPGTSR